MHRTQDNRRGAETRRRTLILGLSWSWFVLGYVDVVVVDFLVVGKAPEAGIAVAIGDGVFHVDDPVSRFVLVGGPDFAADDGFVTGLSDFELEAVPFVGLPLIGDGV